jgi:hypothetical protein
MRKFKTVLLLIATLVGGLAVVPLLHAQDGKNMPSTPMGQGMMGDDNNGSGMMGMMRMMQGMSRMMDHCNGMMNRSRPNDQWRNEKRSGQDNG